MKYSQTPAYWVNKVMIFWLILVATICITNPDGLIDSLMAGLMYGFAYSHIKDDCKAADKFNAEQQRQQRLNKFRGDQNG